ncbi:hypothetical protein T4B_13259 [Trichinella pseudospiralis]|uniref:Uncharacterized protein n=1 Tax=Trichinella pseudospiralis TaxID=6337 RepID=A0A0V1IG83_TRIPS|nr:hypothetical protein T4A_9928 [Trichinella pseudospiralis]KRZ21173.1 hypothetical protein T4B_13259 [Trichinella pseudospiralis]KRZ38830.1 hypothetical protein T4C_9619 [Trichinella pseudospiralis]
MAMAYEHGRVANLVKKVKLSMKNFQLGEATDGSVRVIASGNVDNCNDCFLMFRWTVGERTNLKIEPSFGILEPFERQRVVLEIILDSVQKLIQPNYFELTVQPVSAKQIKNHTSTTWKQSVVEVSIPVELTFCDKALDKNVQNNFAKDENLKPIITVSELVNCLSKLTFGDVVKKNGMESGKKNENFRPTFAITSVGFGEPCNKLYRKIDDKHQAESSIFSSKCIRSIMIVPVNFSEKKLETMNSENAKSKFVENKAATVKLVNGCNGDNKTAVQSDTDLKLNAVKFSPLSQIVCETEDFEIENTLPLQLHEDANFSYSSVESTNTDDGSIEEINGRVGQKNAALKMRNGKQATVIIGDEKHAQCSFNLANSTDISSLETEMTETDYECSSSSSYITTEDSSEETTDTTDDTDDSDSDESDCSGCVSNLSNEEDSSDEDSTVYDFEYECLLEECDENGNEEKAKQQLKKKPTTNASTHKKRSSSICSCCSLLSDTE